jgi:chemotaxis protein MotB
MSDDRPNPWTEGQEESYYISITDMLIGLLFLFIILLMYFALQLRTTTQDLVTADQTRTELLEKVAAYLRERNVQAEVELSAGVLRLPNENLFEKGRDEPKVEGVAALGVLAEALAEHLPCYSYQATPRPESCGSHQHHVEAVFIEGHTDSDPITPTLRLRDNWDLSAARASNTFRILTRARPDLSGFLSARPDAETAREIFSVAGYADRRPVAAGENEASKERNRRIDLRIVMAGPELPN